jgi:hypothetical protein
MTVGNTRSLQRPTGGKQRSGLLQGSAEIWHLDLVHPSTPADKRIDVHKIRDCADRAELGTVPATGAVQETQEVDRVRTSSRPGS